MPKFTVFLKHGEAFTIRDHQNVAGSLCADFQAYLQSAPDAQRAKIFTIPQFEKGVRTFDDTFIVDFAEVAAIHRERLT